LIPEGNHRADCAGGAQPASSITGLGELAQLDFAVVRNDDVVFDVIQWMVRRDALVIRGDGAPRPENVSGVIDKEHIAEAVAASVQVYPA
jgi:CIC family chloride channel protein